MTKKGFFPWIIIIIYYYLLLFIIIYLLFIIYYLLFILPITNTTTRERANASDNPYMLLHKKNINKSKKNQHPHHNPSPEF